MTEQQNQFHNFDPINFKDQFFIRQLAALGKTTLEKLHKMNVLILNSRAVGVELAKNITLTCPNRVSIVDDSIVTAKDLQYNIFIDESSIGLHRSEAMARALTATMKARSPSSEHVNLPEAEALIHTESPSRGQQRHEFKTEIESLPFSALTENTIKQYDLFICTDFYDRHHLEQFNVFCRRNRVNFMHVVCIGTFCHIFQDFQNFKIFDKIFHMRATEFYINNITNDEFGVVTLEKGNGEEDKKHFFKDGDYVSIQEVEGMVEVNGMEARPIRVIDEYSFKIENTTNYGEYQGGGFVNYEKVPFTIKFQSLESSFKEPRFLKIPPSKLSQMEMHAAMLLYFDWAAEIEDNPRVIVGKSDEDLENIALEIFMSNSDVNFLYEEHDLDINKITGLLVDLIKFGDFQFTPIATFIANMSAFQQIVSTGKFLPLD